MPSRLVLSLVLCLAAATVATPHAVHAGEVCLGSAVTIAGDVNGTTVIESLGENDFVTQDCETIVGYP